MAKVGTRTKENSGFADKWHSSLDDKLLAGNIYFGLELRSPDPTEKVKVEHIQLGFKEGSNQGISNFRTGDIVILYPYPEGEEPDARKTMVFRATIERITSDNIYLNLRASQTSGNVFWYQGRREWAIEHDFFDSSFSSLYRGIHSFLSAPKERKDLLLLQRTPQVDSSKTLSGEYGEFNNLVLRAKEAKDLFLIIGPPGTGKTSFGLLNILQEELLSTQDSILLLSYTNRAVDEICGKLIEKKLDFIRIGGKYSCEEACRPFLLDSKVEHCGNISQLKETIKNTRIFVGTTNAVNANINLFKLKHFSLAIVDEASQILEPHLMSLLAAQKEGRAAISKFVMIGDHKQLPAVVQQTAAESRVEEPALRNIGLTDCRLSLFERLLKRYGRDPHVTYQLTHQGRMHPAIARFPNEAFYGGTLREVPLPHQEAGPSPIGWPRLQFIDVPAAPSGDKATPMGGKVNLQEAAVIAQCVSELRGRIGERFTPDSIGVIVPYRHQIAAVRAAIVAASGNDSDAAQDITIDTVERYQGSQRDTIIYGFTVSHPAQLDFLTEQCFYEDGQVIDRKLNVALTRAREHLVLVGNAALLRQNPLYARLIDFTHQAFN